MPLHDFSCTVCGHRFEALQRREQAPVCPCCGSPHVDRLISAPVAPGRSKAIVAAARRQAAREGHLSNYSAAERRKLLS